MSKDPWYVYVVQRKGGTEVYTGATNRPHHRLRAHCGEVAGGAHTTHKWGPGAARMIFLVGPFADTKHWKSKSIALSFEKMMKKCRTGFGGVKGRVRAVHSLVTSVGGIVNKKVHLMQHFHCMQVRTTLSWPEYLEHLGDGPAMYPEGLVLGFGFPVLPMKKKKRDLVKFK